jgi:hypothetical protein
MAVDALICSPEELESYKAGLGAWTLTWKDLCWRFGLVEHILLTGKHPGGSTAALQAVWMEKVGQHHLHASYLLAWT